ncbi:MAG: cobalamin biosynthesis protein CobD [Chloroflexota bacterium]|nr:cobalamin biosynthesis protein CobD [Chloroflexota bacterium]
MGAIVLVGALILDLTVGEPPLPLHPVVWMGAFVDFFVARAPQKPAGRLIWGGLMVGLGVAVAFGAAWFVLWALQKALPLAAALVGMLLLKVTFAAGALGQHARNVQRDLERQELERARDGVQLLVSRPTAELTERQLISATVESVAENTLDSVIAPLFWFLLLGVPGAVAYRFVNTADAMVGYHGPYEHLGKAAARLDDALNWVPARLAFLLIVAGSWLAGLKAGRAWSVGRRCRGLTESPNAGWTMSPAAGALAVPLEKVGHYALGEDEVRNLVPRKIGDAIALMYATTALTVVAFGLLALITPLGKLPWAAL